MYSTAQDLSKNRRRIIDEAIGRFKGSGYFQGLGSPAEDVTLAACEGLFDLMEEPAASRDPKIIRMFMEWLYNLMRRDGVKVDTTIDFLDTYEEIVGRHLNTTEKADIDTFFELCRDAVEHRHKDLLRKAPR